MLVAALPAALSAGEIYRWVDEEGIVHYSDRPREGAELIVLREAQTYSRPSPTAGQVAPEAPKNRPETASQEAAAYSSIEIVSPKQEEVLWNIGGELSVSLRARPRIRSGHSVVLVMDGKDVQQLPNGQLQTRLADVFRGTHSLRADVRDRSGNTVATSDTVQFTVQQTSTQNPNNPNTAGGAG